KVQAPLRRSQLIDRLLKSQDYPKNWANIWTNWLLTRSGPFSSGMYNEKMQVWLQDQLATNAPYHETVRKLITATGKNTDNGAVNFILAHLGEEIPNGKQGEQNKQKEEGYFTMVPITSRITRLFLGIQTQCTQCHDHPFDNNLTQQQFWGINAYLRQVKRDGMMPMRNNRDSKAPLILTDDPDVNTEAVVYYEKVKNSLVKQTKAAFLDGTRISADGDAKTPISGL